MPPSSDKPSLLSAGGGIPRLSEDTVEPETEQPQASIPEVAIQVDEKGDPVWSGIPTFSNQWHEYPDTCKPGKMEVAVFNLVEPTELEAYNALVAQAYPPEAPRIEVLNDIIHPPVDGKMLALVRYRRIQYKRIIRERI